MKAGIKIPVLEPTNLAAKECTLIDRYKKYNPIIISPNDIMGNNNTYKHESIILVDARQILNDEVKTILANNYIQIGFETMM